MKKFLAVAVIALMGGAGMGVLSGAFAGKPAPDKAAVQVEKPTKQEEDRVASIYGATPYIVETIQVSGEIDDSTTTQIKQAVEAVNANPRVKAVVLELDSPGGGAGASAASYEELSKIKVPVVAWCDGMCASGAYYIAMSPSVKFIAARQEAIAGSVGVIMHMTRYNRLLDTLKIDSEVHASGSLKDSGDPTKAPSAEEEQYLQSIIDTLAARFYAVVAKSRPNIRDWKAVKTGRVFIGEEAVKLGLIDATMDLDGAIKKAKELSGKKTIFTRDEMKKIGALADEPVGMKAPILKPLASWGADLHTLVSMLTEIKGGERVEFKYLMPLRF